MLNPHVLALYVCAYLLTMICAALAGHDYAERRPSAQFWGIATIVAFFASITLLAVLVTSFSTTP